jgi:hypothetical protein
MKLSNVHLDEDKIAAYPNMWQSGPSEADISSNFLLRLAR